MFNFLISKFKGNIRKNPMSEKDSAIYELFTLYRKTKPIQTNEIYKTWKATKDILNFDYRIESCKRAVENEIKTTMHISNWLLSGLGHNFSYHKEIKFKLMICFEYFNLIDNYINNIVSNEKINKSFIINELKK